MIDDVEDEFRRFVDAINAGAPVPAVNPEQLKRLWRGVRDIKAASPQRKGMAIAGKSFLSGNPTTTEYLSVSQRANLIDALLERGVLKEFEAGGELPDCVFRAAAMMPINKDDLGEAMLQLHLTKMLPEEAAKINAEWLAEGYDADHPKIDDKFLAAIREAEAE